MLLAAGAVLKYFVGIIGNSGAGKSTLTYAINGVIPHYYTGDFYGEVTVNGYDTVETKPETISTVVGSVFQDIDAQMVASVVEDEILFGLENFGVPKAEIPNRLDEALEKVGIADLRQRAINSLSGGQRQKIDSAAIAAELRGFNLRTKDSSYCTTKFGALDILAFAVGIGIIALGVIF